MSAVQESELSEATRAHRAAAEDGAEELSSGGVADVELLFDALSAPAVRAEAERVFERAAARGLFGEREAVAVLERRRVAALVAAGHRAHHAGAQQLRVHMTSMSARVPEEQSYVSVGYMVGASVVVFGVF